MTFFILIINLIKTISKQFSVGSWSIGELISLYHQKLKSIYTIADIERSSDIVHNILYIFCVWIINFYVNLYSIAHHFPTKLCLCYLHSRFSSKILQLPKYCIFTFFFCTITSTYLNYIFSYQGKYVLLLYLKLHLILLIICIVYIIYTLVIT